MFGNQIGSNAFQLFAGNILKASFMSNEDRKAPSKSGDENLSKDIGKNLRQMYDDVLNEPVPDDFLALLQKADSNNSKA